MHTVRYELEQHPETVGKHRPVPNAWKCTGFDSTGRVTVIQVGDTAQGALARAVDRNSVYRRVR